MPALTQQQSNNAFKLRLLTLLTKLTDRDTCNLAFAELTNIIHTLETQQHLSLFLSCLLTSSPTTSTNVRKLTLSLLTTLIQTHAYSLSGQTPKILNFLTRHVKDLDSSSRPSAAGVAEAVAVNVTKVGVGSIVKPLMDALCGETEGNAQIGMAVCLRGVIEGAGRSRGKECGIVAGKLVGRLERLVRGEAFRGKSKAEVLGLIGCCVGIGGIRDEGVLKGVVGGLVEFLKNEDWGIRKGAAETLGVLAVKERDSVSEFKEGCVKVLESRRFDKVKAVREIMNQALEAWKQVPDLSVEASPPPRSQGSSREDPSDGHYPPSFPNRLIPSTPQMRKRSPGSVRSTPVRGSIGSTGRKRSPLKASDKNASATVYGKMDQKKPWDGKIDNAIHDSPAPEICEDDPIDRDENVPQGRNVEGIMFRKADMMQTPLSKKIGSFRSRSRVSPCGDESLGSVGVASNATEDIHRNHKDSEELSSIKKQLVQIEKQQSGLMDLLQNFIGSSQHGMRSLEARVHGLEVTLDEISYDLAVSTGRMTNTDTLRTRCCLLPATDFLSPKFWRKSEGQYSTSRFSTASSTPSVAGARYRRGDNVNIGSLRPENRRFRPIGSAGFIVNPLAEIQSESRGV